MSANFYDFMTSLPLLFYIAFGLITSKGGIISEALDPPPPKKNILCVPMSFSCM